MKVVKKLMFAFVSLLLSISAAGIELLANEFAVLDYQKFLDGRSPYQVHSYDNEFFTLEVAELHLVIRALAFSTNSFNVRWEPWVTLDDIANTDVIAKSYWLTELAKYDGIDLSNPVVNEGDFQAVMMTYPTNKLLEGKALAEVTASSVADWSVDWRSLERAGVQGIVDAPSWIDMVQMVVDKQADFLIAPHGSVDRLIDTHGLVPVEGRYIALHGQRAFAVNSTNPSVLEALNRGIKRLEQSGELREIMQAAGMLALEEKGWVNAADSKRNP